MILGAHDFEALARKYRALVALRTRRDQAQETTVSAATLQGLARECPGCLRELDTLGPAELARRAAAAAAAADGAEPEPWMAWIAGYHLLMRAALEIRRRRVVQALDADADALARELAAPKTDGPAPIALDAAFVEAVVAPPAGRLGIVVLRRLALHFGQPAPDIAAALFPLRRPSPYQL